MSRHDPPVAAEPEPVDGPLGRARRESQSELAQLLQAALERRARDTTSATTEEWQAGGWPARSQGDAPGNVGPGSG